MTEKIISTKLRTIIPHLHPNTNQANIMTAHGIVTSAIQDVELLENELITLKSRIQELESS